MALGTELERNLVPGISGSGCSSRDAPREEANISSHARGKAVSGCLAGVEYWILAQGRAKGVFTFDSQSLMIILEIPFQ